MKKNKFIIVGMGSIGKALLQKLSKDIDITCIDLNPEAEEAAKLIRNECTVVTGDATSRLVLENAGVADADTIIIATTEEKVNIEVATIIKNHFESKRVISIGLSTAGIEALESAGAEVENIFTSSAIAIRNKLEQTSRTAHAIGLGKNEILEVEVHPNSRLANKALRALTPIRWRIGILYRDDNIIIPRRDTVLKPGDRVIILGDPGVLRTVSEILTFRFERFPLEFGSTVIAYLTGSESDAFFNELGYLFSVFPLDKAVFLCAKKAERRQAQISQQIEEGKIKNFKLINSSYSVSNSIRHAVEELKGDHGLIALSNEILNGSLSRRIFHGKSSRLLRSIMKIANSPILLSAGSFPYEKVAVPCAGRINLQNTLETALEITSSLQNEVTALLTAPSKYISSDDDVKRFDDMKKTIHEVSAMYKKSVKRETLNGNPVKSVSSSLPDFDLMITDAGGWKQQRWFMQILDPDIIWHIIKDSSISTLLLPEMEGSL